MFKIPALLSILPILLLSQVAPSAPDADASDAARVRQALDTLAAHPLSHEADVAAALIAEVAEKSEAVAIVLTAQSLPWTSAKVETPHSGLLLAAHLAGNMLSQFDSGVCSSDAYSGTLAVFRVYRQLQADEKGYSVPAIDDMLKAHRLGRLTARVQTPRGLSDPSAVPAAPDPPAAEERRTNPKVDGYVPDAETAIAIAVAVWGPIYGQEETANEAPYRAKLEKGVWSVRGTLPPEWLGGTVEAQINRADGRILKIWASK